MTTTADLALVRRGLRILEPFFGAGRVLLPLARDGHTMRGLDNAPAMLDRAAAKDAALPEAVQARITLSQADVLQTPWPTGFDVVPLRVGDAGGAGAGHRGGSKRAATRGPSLRGQRSHGG